jgi:hypothetical protein
MRDRAGSVDFVAAQAESLAVRLALVLVVAAAVAASSASGHLVPPREWWTTQQALNIVLYRGPIPYRHVRGGRCKPMPPSTRVRGATRWKHFRCSIYWQSTYPAPPSYATYSGVLHVVGLYPTGWRFTFTVGTVGRAASRHETIRPKVRLRKPKGAPIRAWYEVTDEDCDIDREALAGHIKLADGRFREVHRASFALLSALHARPEQQGRADQLGKSIERELGGVTAYTHASNWTRQLRAWADDYLASGVSFAARSEIEEHRRRRKT